MEILLHPGMHKTGTSAIQLALHGFDDGQLRYAGFDTPNHSIPMTTIFSDQPEVYHIHRTLGRSAAEVAELAAQFRAVLARDLALDRQRLVISGEDIAHLTPGALARMAEMLGRNVRVLVYLRNLHGFASSVAQERVKQGAEQLAFVAPNYRRRFEKFIDLFGVHQVQFVSYESATAQGRSVVSDFLPRIGLPEGATSDRRANESLGHQAALLLAKFNATGIARKPGPVPLRARRRLMRVLTKLFPGPGFRLPASHFAAEIDHADVDWMETACGFDLSTPATYEPPPAPMPDGAVMAVLTAFARKRRIDMTGATDVTTTLIRLYEFLRAREQDRPEK